MPDIVLTLGGFEFSDFEVPEKIAGLGGQQMLTVHKMLGGARTIDAMGRDDAPITWGGRFRGQDAIARARAIDTMRIAGAAIDLTFGDFSLSVVIEGFVFDFERFYEIPYSITLLVVSDNSTPGAASTPSVGEMLTSDASWAESLGGDIGDTVLSGHLSALQTAISGVTDFANAALAVRQSLLAPIRDAQARAFVLISEAETTVLEGRASVTGGLLS